MNAFRIVRPIALLVLAFAISPPTFSAVVGGTEDPSSRLLRDASLMILKEGNARFAAGKSQHPHLDAERRTSTMTQGQEPFATILACSDSREPVELIFDRGVGDLFVVRVAGNIAGSSELASVEYGVGHLNTPLLIVMGHSRCSAVTAVVEGAELHGHFRTLAEKIKPAVATVKPESVDVEDAVPKSIQANVWQTIEDVLKQSRTVREKVAAGQAHLMGALYDLESGKVSWLGSHPTQDTLIVLAEQAETDAALANKLAVVPNPLPKSTTSRTPPSIPPAGLREDTSGQHHGSDPGNSARQPKHH